ncbi:integrin alpha-4-like isoform X2 [Microplitis mediator]|uniref:integrin alpha-4-like isoform X2 n=1 Tax=Microplitis mediator TaxID=375433 RepID=UPI0025533E28|nr:integrin alpha-4-like isoform X2 [Microplitis mediator]
MPVTKNQLVRVSKLSIIIFINLLLTSDGYNLNTDEAVVFKDPFKRPREHGSYFGYSVALFSDGYIENSAVIVGAPRANVSSMHEKEPGSVFKCTLDGRCREWMLENSRNGGVPGIYGHQIRDYSWLGASISVENSTRPRVVVCAPGWKIKLATEVFMNGLCYYSLIDSPESFDRGSDRWIMPLTDHYLQTQKTKTGQVVYRYGMGQLGMSVHDFNQNGHWNIMLGSPGAFHWLGTPVLVSEAVPGALLQSVVPDYDNLDYGYFGYSVTSGYYFGQSKRYFAAGAPRSDDTKGRVFIFLYGGDKRNLIFKNTLSGTQLGEYFGSALTSCDIDNNGDDELIVGAPLWTKTGDEGRVYIFTNKYNTYMELSSWIDGKVEDARFGLSVMCLGDIDNDGYKDIAVGAPYENDHGAVYIFNGQQQGLSKTWSQKITGDQFPDQLQGFGFSISEPRDVDANGYPDFAVGAFKSSHAVLFRARSVINLNIEVTYDDDNKLQSDTKSFFIRVCCFYEGVYAPEFIKTIRRLTVDPTEGRAYLTTTQKTNGSYNSFDKLPRGEIVCERFHILLMHHLKNVLDPIEITASVSLEPPQYDHQNPLTQKNFCYNCPVINELRSKTEDILNLPFAVDCGPDNICYSNITLDVTTNLADNRYIIGTQKTINISINAINFGEKAYQAQVNLILPSFITLASVPLNCIENTHDMGEIVTCDIGNPLKDKQLVLLEIDVSQVNSDKKQTDLLINVITQSENINKDNSSVSLKIFFDVDVDIAVAGKAQEDLYSFFNGTESTSDIIRFEHVYEVRKFGATSIEQSVLKVLIPTHLIIDEKNTLEIATINRTELSLPKTMINTYNSFCSEGIVENRTGLGNNNSIENVITKDNLLNILTEDRTFYINCSNPSIICTSFYCVLQTPLNSSTIAEVTFTLDLKLKNFDGNILDGKDVIYFVSNGHANITLPADIIQINDDKSDYVGIGTTFVGSPIAKPVAVWIIALSVVLGIILLIILTIILVRVGFFNRKKKEELEALKADDVRET